LAARGFDLVAKGDNRQGFENSSIYVADRNAAGKTAGGRFMREKKVLTFYVLRSTLKSKNNPEMFRFKLQTCVGKKTKSFI